MSRFVFGQYIQELDTQQGLPVPAPTPNVGPVAHEWVLVLINGQLLYGQLVSGYASVGSYFAGPLHSAQPKMPTYEVQGDYVIEGKKFSTTFKVNSPNPIKQSGTFEWTILPMDTTSYDTVQSKLSDLLFQEPGEDTVPPTRYAYDRAASLLLQAWHILRQKKEPMPVPAIGTSEHGGIYLSWRNAVGSVVALVPRSSGRRGYIDETVGDRPVERNVIAQNLADSLIRFNSWEATV